MYACVFVWFVCVNSVYVHVCLNACVSACVHMHADLYEFVCVCVCEWGICECLCACICVLVNVSEIGSKQSFLFMHNNQNIHVKDLPQLYTYILCK